MARWGNALGGWRKQKRNAKGQFGSGRSSAVRLSKKPSKRWSKRKKAAVAVGVVAGVAAVGAASYGMEYRSRSKEFRKAGGAVSTVDLGGGYSATTHRSLKKRYTKIDEVAVVDMYNAKNLRQLSGAAVRIWQPSLRPQIHSTTYLHKGDELMGYTTDVSKGKRLYANSMYLKPGARGSLRTGAALSSQIKGRQKSAVDSGKKIVISKYRSEDSERIVRNQKRQLGKNKVIVRKRYDPSSDFARDIIKSMDSHFQHTMTPGFKEARKASQKKSKSKGVLI